LSRDLERQQTFRVGQWNLSILERYLAGDIEDTDGMAIYRRARDQGHKHPITGKPMLMPIQWGALGEPFDNIERNQGWALEAAKLFVKYDTPVRISTKGSHLLLTQPEYLDAISHPNFWVACSLISIDDEMLLKVDRGTPPASERLKMLAELSRRGVPTALRFRPIIQGLSDATKKHPYAWRELLDRAAEAGVQAISMEYVFIPGAQPPHIKQRMNELDEIVGWEMNEFYRKSTVPFGACLRSSRAWKQDMTMAIYEHCKKLGIRFGHSEPHFKELNDTGSCCGLPDDPKDPHYDYFGGWSRNNATNAVVEAKALHEAGKPALIKGVDYIPEWSYSHPMIDMCMMVKASQAMQIFKWSWGDKLHKTWNDLKSPRGPLHYFEGVLQPDSLDKNGDVIYKYVPYEMRDIEADTGWDLNEDYPGLDKLKPIKIPKFWNRTHKSKLGAEVGNVGKVEGIGGELPVKPKYRGGAKSRLRKAADKLARKKK
jgi:DNA repair photolyase